MSNHPIYNRETLRNQLSQAQSDTTVTKEEALQDLKDFAEALKKGERLLKYVTDPYHALAPVIEAAFGADVRAKSRVRPKSGTSLEMARKRLSNVAEIVGGGNQKAVLIQRADNLDSQAATYEERAENLRDEANELRDKAQNMVTQDVSFLIA